MMTVMQLLTILIGFYVKKNVFWNDDCGALFCNKKRSCCGGNGKWPINYVNKSSNNKHMKLFLFFLTAFVALTAIVCGALLMSYPEGSLFGMSTALLKATPFSNFFVPGFILCIVVGGTNLVAVVLNMQTNPLRYNWSIAGAVMLLGWVVVQMLLIAVLHWLQFVYLGIGLMILLLSWQLKGKWAV
jgi:hypothetical protein